VVQLRGADGELIEQREFAFDESGAVPVPEIDAETVMDATGRELVSADSSGQGPNFRALLQPVGGGQTVVVAIPLSGVNNTLERLVVVEVIVGVITLAILGVVAWFVVRRTLRPLDRMEGDATRIAAGDLSRRVEPANDRTEVGRLGLALNQMLGEIESSFAARRASEERLRRFVADASHELRTPLSSIRGYAELFRRGASERPEDLDVTMRRIEDEAARMGVLVDDLLLLARLDEGGPTFARERVDLAAIVHDACADARARAPERTVTCDAPGHVVVTGDEDRLRQVAANLVGNALAHTPTDSPVTIRALVVDGRAQLEVADRGPGIPEADLPSIFDRFWRADKSRDRSTGGAGLGLSIVAAIVEGHGGTVSAENVEGGGARFVASFPLQETI
jgi:two-component system OmpR family sensor kinase